MTTGTKTGIIFNTQKFSIHDGTGIRTLIFMKGCPLRCLWCSNPESQAPGLEIMDVKTNCIGCGACVMRCGQHAIKAEGFEIDRSLCIQCGACAKTCYANAKKVIGREVTVRELMELIEKDRIFYTNSGGGVTIGGGEPTLQHEFVTELLRACRESNVHTAIETCGYGEWERIKSIFDYTDQIFFDLKAMDAALHRKLTGVENGLILENAAHAAQTGAEVIFRIPLIPGCNDGEDNIRATGAFVSGLSADNDRISIEILPYHDFGKDKYRWLDVEYGLNGVEKPAEERVEDYRRILKKQGCRVI